MSKEIKNKIVPKLRFTEFKEGEEWKEKTLGQLGQLVGGLTYSPEDVRESGLLVLRSSNVQNGEIVLDDCVYVDPNTKGANLSKPNDILICVRNGSKNLIGKNAIIPEGMPLCTHGAFMTIFRAPAPVFVFQLFQTKSYEQQISGDLGATINSINGSNFIKYKFFVPSSPYEQQKIADCLSSLDELITAQSQKLQALKTHKKGLMQQLFPAEGETMPTPRFAEFKGSGEWEECLLGQMIDIKGRIGYRGYTVEDIVSKGEGAISLSPSNFDGNGSLRFDKSTYISWLKYEESPEIMLQEGFTVLVKTGSSYGKTSLVKKLPEKSTINPQIVVLKPININPFFLFLLVSHSTIQKQIEETVVGGAIPTLSQESISKFEVSVPKKDEQQKIAACFSSLDELVEAQAAKIEVLKVHKKGLMQGLFPAINDRIQTS